MPIPANENVPLGSWLRSQELVNGIRQHDLVCDLVKIGGCRNAAFQFTERQVRLPLATLLGIQPLKSVKGKVSCDLP